MKTLLFAGATALALLSSPRLALAQSSAENHAETSFSSAVFPAADPTKLWVVADPMQQQTLLVELVDSRGRTLAAERVAGRGGAFRQRFDLGELGDGIYTVRVSDGIQTQARTFRLLSTPRLVEQLPTRQLNAVAVRR